MRKVIMTACDVSDKKLVLRTAVDCEAPRSWAADNHHQGRQKMIQALKQQAQQEGAERIVFAYEASATGFGLYDDLTHSGIECHVLAPTGIARSLRDQRNKTDKRDARQLLDLLRAHVLAGNSLPDVWIPDPALRDEREVVRARLDAQDKLAMVKCQIKTLLKRFSLQRPAETGKKWTRTLWQWLEKTLCGASSPLGPATQAALGSLLRQHQAMEQEVKELERAVGCMSRSPRYADDVQALCRLCGVGVLTAMVFLTEIGDMNRFSNRRQVGAYLGLAPSAYETGETSDRKGRITRQGPGRVRRALCQAVWVRLRYDEREQQVCERIVAGKKKRKRKAIVACMRRLGVQMWHAVLNARAELASVEPSSAPARQKGAAPPAFAVASPQPG